MSIITLTSDFGNLDYRVAAVKGSILSLNQKVNIVDITHDIQAFNLIQTSYIVRNAYKHFPKGTIHIVSVDSFHNKSRKIFYIKQTVITFWRQITAFKFIFFDIKPEAIYEITNNRFDDIVNFTSTDVFVPAAVHLANGGLPEVIGRKIDTAKQLLFPKPVYNESEKMIIGEVTYIDNFGNIISNINKDFLKSAKDTKVSR
jgi:S-adenosylmethionine hydrolase